jgi:hypothetical protein
MLVTAPPRSRCLPVQRVPTLIFEGTMDNKDIKVTLLYNLDEVNVLLTLLGSLPFNQSAQMIANIRDQALPQLPIATEQQKGTD